MSDRAAVPASRPPRLRGELRAAVVVNMVIVAFSTATGGLGADLLQLYASQTLGFAPGAIGTGLAFLLLSVPLQLRAPSLVRRLGYRRTMRTGYAASLVLLLALAGLPAIANPTSRYVAFVATVVLIEIVVSCSWGSAWHAWMRRLAAPQERARFLSLMRGAAQVFNLALTSGFALLVGVAVSAREYRGLLAVLGAALVVSLVLLGRMGSPAVPPAPAGRGLAGAVLAAWRRPRLRRLHLLILLETVLLVPVLPLFLLQVVGVDAAVVGLTVAVRGVVSIVATFACGRALVRWGGGRVLAAAGGTLALTTCAYLPLTAGGPGADASTRTVVAVVALGALAAVASAGYASSTVMLWYDSVPDDLAVELFTVQDLLTSARVQVGFLVAGWALEVLGAHRFVLGDTSFSAFGLYLLLAATAGAGTVMLGRRLAGARPPVVSPA